MGDEYNTRKGNKSAHLWRVLNHAVAHKGNLRNFQRTIKMNQVQSFNFGNIAVSFRTDGFLNATVIASHFGKQARDYLKTEQTQQYITALAENLSVKTKILTKENQIVIVKRGGSEQGTWLHPKLAIHFARWLDPKFAVWCDEQIEALLNGKVSDGPAAKTTADDRTPLRQAVAALVGRKGIDYSSAYNMVHQRFNVAAIEDIPAGQLPEAVRYVHALTLSDDRQPLLDGLDIERLAVVVYYGTWALEMLYEVSHPLKQLGNPKAATMYTLWSESRSWIRNSIKALYKIIPALEPNHAEHVRNSLERINKLGSRFIC